MKHIIEISLLCFFALFSGCTSTDESSIFTAPSTLGISDMLNSVVITGQAPDSIQLDPFELRAIEIVGDTISLNITYVGGCKEHDFALFMSPAAFLESFPVQANLYLRHDSHGDACEALIPTTVAFNLRPIAELYQNFYGPDGEIMINVFDYFQDEPGQKISASYFP